MSDYLVDSILPAQEIHLIAGPSGAGKSTWLLQFIEQWRQGKPFLGYASHPQPFVYISADRSERSVQRIFERLKLRPEDFSVETASTIASRDLFSVLLMLRKRHPSAKVFFIEGFQSFQHKMNDYDLVAAFLTKLLRYCVQEDITIIGVCHATKTKKDEAYENPRQKINGSVAWAAYSETVVFIEPAVPGDPTNTERRIMILPRNAAERAYLMGFKNGMLVEKTKPLTSWERMLKWIDSLQPGQHITTEEIMVATQTPRSTLALDLNKATAAKLLAQVKTGVYRRVNTEQETDA